MTTDYKVTSLFCVIDDFCKLFEAENAGHLLLEEDGVRRRRRKTSLSDSEIITILLYFHFGTFRNFKHYYLFFIKGTMRTFFQKRFPITVLLNLKVGYFSLSCSS